MAAITYVLCFAASILCAVLLLRKYFARRTELLFWASLAFWGLALNNFLLIVDLLIFPTSIDLALARSLTALVSLFLLIYGLIWEVR